MAIYADRVKESSTTTGSGTYSLAGAATGFRTFVAGAGSTSVVTYCAEDGTNWEIGEGTVTSGTPDTLSRTTVLASSNAGAAVTWAAGTRNIFLTASAARVATTDKATTFSSSLAAASLAVTGAITSNSLTVGYLEIPQNSQSAAYTLVLADSGKHVLHPTADTTARVFTIPANASVAYPIGTALTIINQSGAGVVTIAITTDTMRLAGAGTTGSRTLAANGVATATKLTSTEWIIAGAGLS